MKKFRRERIYILPTQSGLLFLFSSFLMILVGSAYENSLANILAFFVLSLILISMVQTHNLLRSLEIQSVQVQNGFAEGSFSATVIASEKKRFFYSKSSNRSGVHLRLKAKPLSQPSPPFESQFPVQTNYYKSQGRGFYEGQDIVIETRAPLGLFRAWSPRKFKYTYYIYPKPLQKVNRPLEFGTKLKTSETSMAQGNQEGSEDFSDLRTFQKGDSVSRLAWKVWARRGEFMAKSFLPSQSPYRILDESSIDFLPSEERLSQLCFWILEQDQARTPFMLRLKNISLGPSQGNEFIAEALKTLSLYDSKEGAKLDES